MIVMSQSYLCNHYGMDDGTEICIALLKWVLTLEPKWQEKEPFSSFLAQHGN